MKGGAAASVAVPLELLHARHSRPWFRSAETGYMDTAGLPLAEMDPAQIKSIALKAIDAARQAGADYADVRLSRTSSQTFYVGATVMIGGVSDSQYAAISVRALVNGVWGFAASSVWTEDEAIALANSAVSQARAVSGVLPPEPPVEMPAIPAVEGQWQTPIQIDPFLIPEREKIDFLTSWMEGANHIRRGVSHGVSTMRFSKQLKVLATTDGSYVTQTLYASGGEFPIYVSNPDWRQSGSISLGADGLERSGAGWELFLQARIPDQFERLVAEGEEILKYSPSATAVGRFDVILDALTTARIFDATLGVALEPDRILGRTNYHAPGTYLRPPLERVIGSRQASPLLNVSANRHKEGGLATVMWDEEGVEPSDFSLIKEGRVTELPLTREQAAWLPQGRSNGSAGADSAIRMPFQTAPNYVIESGSDAVSLQEMIADTRRGYLIHRGFPRMDFQSRSGTIASPLVRHIINGKLFAPAINAIAFVEMPQFWRSLDRVGSSVEQKGIDISRFKGSPFGQTSHTIWSVPVRLRNVPVGDGMRRL